MKTKMMLRLFLLAFVATTINQVHAGQEGHGGVVVKCENKIELADFWEAKILHKKDPNFILKISDENVSTQVKKAFDKLTSYRASAEIGLSSEELYKEYEEISSRSNEISAEDVYWQFSNDVGLFKKLPDNCKLDNVIHYIRDNYVDKRSDYYNSLSKTEKAALWVHEVIYKRTRENGQKNSQVARRITAFLFSNLTDQEVASGLILGFLSDKSVIFEDRASARMSLSINVDSIKPGAGNYAHPPLLKTVWNGKTVCKKVPRRILGTKEVCEELEEVTNDFDILSTRLGVTAMSGTRVSFKGTISLVLSSKRLIVRDFEIDGLTGQKGLPTNYVTGVNYLIFTQTYYIASEAKTFNYLYGRVE